MSANKHPESLNVNLERRHAEDSYSWIHSENKDAMLQIVKALESEERKGNFGHTYYSIYTDAMPLNDSCN